MNIKLLNESIDVLKEGLRSSLLSTDIISVEDGQSIAGFNSNPEASALFNKITTDMEEALEGAGFPGLGRYYLLDLLDGNKVLIIPMDEYQWNMLVDSNVQLGLLLNVILPKIIDAFEEAVLEDM